MYKINAILLIIAFLLLCIGCSSKVESIIKVGMELKKAEKILMNFGAQETQLQIRPEKSITGEYMNLEIYALSQSLEEMSQNRGFRDWYYMVKQF